MKRRWRRIVLSSTTFVWWLRHECEASRDGLGPPRRSQIVYANPEGARPHALRVRFTDSASARSGWPHDGCIFPAGAPRRMLFLHHPAVVRAIIEAALEHGFDPTRSGEFWIDDGFILFDEISRRHQAVRRRTVEPVAEASTGSAADPRSEAHRADDVPAGEERDPHLPDQGAEPLYGLLAALKDACADAWIAKHAPLDGLESMWRACPDARLLLELLERTDRHAAVRAACACARTVLHLVRPGNDDPLIAIETAEAWARSEASSEQCRAAADAAGAGDTDYSLTAAGEAANAANASAAAAAYTAAGDDAYDEPDGPAARVASRAAIALAIATANDHRWEREFDAALSALADIVRAVATCPPVLRTIGYEGPIKSAAK